MPSLDKIMKRNPVLQFSTRANRTSPPMLSNRFSDTGMGVGLGQELFRPSEDVSKHVSASDRHQTHLAMMKFDMNQRSSI